MTEQSDLEASRGKLRRWWFVVMVPVAVIMVVIAVGMKTERSTGAPEAFGTTVPQASEHAVPVKEAESSSPSDPEPESSPDPSATEFDVSDHDEDTPAELDEEAAPTAPLPKPIKIKIDQAAQLTETVTAQVGSIGHVRAVGRGPGEMSGAALRVTFDLTNNGTTPLDLSTTIVTLGTVDGEPASPVDSDSSADPLMGTLAPGESATGVYLFIAPKGLDRNIQVDFSTSTKEPVLIFRGHPGDVGSK